MRPSPQVSPHLLRIQFLPVLLPSHPRETWGLFEPLPPRSEPILCLPCFTPQGHSPALSRCPGSRPRKGRRLPAVCLVSGHLWCHEDGGFPEGPQLRLGLWVPGGLRIERGEKRQKVRKERGTKKGQKRRSKELTPSSWGSRDNPERKSQKGVNQMENERGRETDELKEGKTLSWHGLL